ncbi:uncharacterized protein LOC134665522 [Cydia fagiglandana]|uniref:uncharacterized protein LOC134665522 n=1 Tax=Cydia fagiglandana TaxID=1458189 RepID=UPI002FEE1BE7
MFDSSSSDEEEALLLLLTQNTPTKPKRVWIHEINGKRGDHSEYHNLCRELESHEDRFYWYFHMSRDSFEELHDLVRPHILKNDTNYRKAIGTRERLAVCLRYIRTGDSFLTISFSFRIGRSTVSIIVEEVSKAIWECLPPIHMPSPTEEIWKQSELGYQEIWNFPNAPLPGTTEPVPHVLLGDEGFALQTFLMRPFPGATTIHDQRKRRYNYRLCRARRVVENTFGISAEKWRIFHRPMECHIEKAIHVTKAACCLHNFVRIKHGDMMRMLPNEPTSSQNLPENAATSQNLEGGALIPLRRTNASNIAPPDIRRQKCLAREFTKMSGNTLLPIHEDLSGLKNTRLKSRNPPAKSFHTHSPTWKDSQAWLKEWEAQQAKLNNTLYEFSTDERPKGFNESRQIWCKLNRLRTGFGNCSYLWHKWGWSESAACECGNAEQTIHHMVFECPITKYNGPAEDFKNLTKNASLYLHNCKF